MSSSTSLYLGAPMDLGFVLQNSPPVLDEVLPGLLAGTVGMLATPQRVRERSRGLIAFGSSVVLFVAAMAAATMAIKLIQG